jgi:tetratricopeptide (TPR) repeat protein
MRPLLGLVVGFLVVAVGCARSSDSQPPTNTSAAAAHEEHPAAPAPRTTLLGNLGSYHRAITATDESQKFFDEGLTLLYGFNHEEAFRSFERAATLDPKAPMPHWGMSLALGTNYNDTATPDRLQQAYKHLTEAQSRAANGTDMERAFIDALAKRYVATPDDGNQPKREAEYSAAMGAVSKRFPDDLDAATLYAESMMNLRPWKLYTFDGTPEPGTEEIVATLESVMKRNPDHPGANHYHIHAVEASKNPDRGVTSAKRLETLVPGAGHLVHMPAHIWMRTGDYGAAVKTNADAAALDEKYVKATGAKGLYPTMYYGHNLQFESAAAMMAGNLRTAREAGRKTADLVAPMAGDMAMLQPFALQEVLALVRFGRWDEVLAQLAPPAGRDLQSAVYHFTRGAALAGKGQADEAAKELTALEASAARVPKDVMYSTVNPAPVLLDVARADLAARIADARGNVARSVAAWKIAVAA